jgi:hypothetical protein
LARAVPVGLSREFRFDGLFIRRTHPRPASAGCCRARVRNSNWGLFLEVARPDHQPAR